jgi:hypothetical protein
MEGAFGSQKAEAGEMGGRETEKRPNLVQVEARQLIKSRQIGWGPSPFTEGMTDILGLEKESNNVSAS